MPVKQSYHQLINERLKESGFRRLATDAVDVLQQGPKLFGTFDDNTSFEIPFMDIYCQSARPQFLKYEDLVLAALAWQRVQAGDLAYSFLDTPCEPLRDSDVDGNQAILRRMVRDYSARNPLGLIDADFWGGKNGEDGYLRFGVPPISHFEGFATDLAGIPETPPREPVDGKCTRFPLEVGDCLPDQIEFHLQQTSCVARFPYHHTFIVLLEEVGPSRWTV